MIWNTFTFMNYQSMLKSFISKTLVYTYIPFILKYLAHHWVIIYNFLINWNLRVGWNIVWHVITLKKIIDYAAIAVSQFNVLYFMNKERWKNILF